MISRHYLRRRLIPWAGLGKSVAVFLGGVAIFLVGSALSYKLLIVPALDALATQSNQLLLRIVSEEQVEIATHFLGLALLVFGFYMMFLSGRMAVRHLVETVSGVKSGAVADFYLRRQQLAQGPRIVAIGGGTGLSTLLRGLKQHTSNITAIVTVTDDGGSSGRLVQEKGMIPPGDIRNCLVALADAEKSMTDLFQHRFKNDSGSLSGHAIGNLLIAALVDQARGDFEKAVEIASDVLAIRGRVVPSTLDRVHLRALLENGQEICGETAIGQSNARIERIFLEPEGVAPHKGALDAIRTADVICIGPGSVYTSIIPNLLVTGVVDALKESPAPVVFVCNVMTQPGESEGFTASEHVIAVQKSVQAKVFDYVVVNTGVPSQAAIEKYRESGQHLVDADIDRIKALGMRAIGGNLMSETDFVRHDPMRVAERIVDLARG